MMGRARWRRRSAKRGGKGAARRVREGHKQACRKGPAEREKRVLGGAQGKGGSGPSVTKGTAERAGAHLSTGVRAVSTAGLISSTGHASRSAPHGLISAAATGVQGTNQRGCRRKHRAPRAPHGSTKIAN
eukprot:2908599-Prymnesium_polylepis.2